MAVRDALNIAFLSILSSSALQIAVYVKPGQFVSFLLLPFFFVMSTKLKGTPYLFFAFQAVYIAPLKALVRERMDDWKVRFEQKLGRR